MNVHQVAKRGRGRPSGSGKDYSTDERYQAWKQAFLDGATYEEIGSEWGVTRQRVEQVMRKLGVVSARQRQRDNMAVVVGTIQRKDLTIAEAAEMFGIPRFTVWNYCRQHDVKPSRMTQAEVSELSSMASRVIAGGSRRAVAGSRAKTEKLRRYMRDSGIDARGRSRHDDFSERKVLVTRWREEGLTWAQCAVSLSNHDGRKIGTYGLYNWVCKHMPHLVGRSA